MPRRRPSTQPLARGAVSAAAVALLFGLTGCAGGMPASGSPPDRPTANSGPSPAAATTTQHRKAHRRHRAARPHRHRRGRPSAAGVPATDVPNRSLTPGIALPVSVAQICRPGYASSVRDVPDSEKDAVYAEYGVAHVPYAHEVDHLISLELGGSNAIANLWPEPYAGRWGAGTKDQLENRLHDLVCTGSIRLAYAQHIEAANWVAAYRRYVSRQPPRPTNHASGSGGGSGGATAGGSGKCTPGYSPCLVNHGGADYDCAGGGGNGPYFTVSGVTYTVTGSDPYHLDGNHDGRACG